MCLLLAVLRQNGEDEMKASDESRLMQTSLSDDVKDEMQELISSACIYSYIYIYIYIYTHMFMYFKIQVAGVPRLIQRTIGRGGRREETGERERREDKGLSINCWGDICERKGDIGKKREER